VSLCVVDASVLAAFYAADDPRRTAVSAKLTAGNALYAPAHLDVEVISALRGMAKASPPLRAAVPGALRHLAALALRRIPLAGLLDRMWELRDNLTPYDAAYVALAEQLRCALLTCDSKLAAVPGAECDVDLVS
jgi:predicted nucleic acid-binding protein